MGSPSSRRRSLLINQMAYFSLPFEQLVGGRLAPVTLNVSIPALQSSRKIRVTLDQTVGDLVRSVTPSPQIRKLDYSCSTVLRRLPDPTSSQWRNYALFLRGSGGGLWLEDYKFLSSYKLVEKVRYATNSSIKKSISNLY